MHNSITAYLFVLRTAPWVEFFAHTCAPCLPGRARVLWSLDLMDPGGTMVSLITGIAAAVAEGADGMNVKPLSMMGVDRDNNEVLPEVDSQYWPESITVDTQPGWSGKAIPGGSHPIGSWANSGGLSISFDLFVHQDMMEPEDRTGVASVIDGLIDPHDSRNSPRNLPVDAFYRYMLAFTMPRRGSAEGGSQVMLPPPIMVISLPGLALAPDGGDVFWAEVSTLNLQILKSFPNGRPRMARISVGLTQTVMDSRGVYWTDSETWAKSPRSTLLKGGFARGGGPRG